MGREPVQEDPQHGGASDARGDAGVELQHLVQRKSRQKHPAAGRAGAGSVREQAGRVGYHFSPRYCCASKHQIDDSRYHGPRDQSDTRECQPYTLVGHKSEVCGLKWSYDDRELASGGNDNQLFIWSANSTHPLLRYSDHTAAVKAIAWSPHQHGLLASGWGAVQVMNSVVTHSLQVYAWLVRLASKIASSRLLLTRRSCDP
jgi:hypothetical protein